MSLKSEKQDLHSHLTYIGQVVGALCAKRQFIGNHLHKVIHSLGEVMSLLY